MTKKIAWFARSALKSFSSNAAPANVGRPDRRPLRTNPSAKFPWRGLEGASLDIRHSCQMASDHYGSQQPANRDEPHARSPEWGRQPGDPIKDGWYVARAAMEGT